MSQPNPQAAERARAAEDLEDIQRLNKYQPFQRYFVRRVLSERDKVKASVLDPASLSLPENTRRDMLVKYTVLDEIANMLVQDEAGCRSILEQTSDEPEGEEQPIEDS